MNLVDNVLFAVKAGNRNPDTGDRPNREQCEDILNGMTNYEFLQLIADALETELEAIKGDRP